MSMLLFLGSSMLSCLFDFVTLAPCSFIQPVLLTLLRCSRLNLLLFCCFELVTRLLALSTLFFFGGLSLSSFLNFVALASCGFV